MLNKLSKEVFDNAHAKGFWDEFNLIIKKVRDAREPDGTMLFSPQEESAIKMAFTSQRLMLIVSELGEMVEAKRTGKIADLVRYHNAEEENNGFEAHAFKQFVKDSPEDELADALIRIMDMAGGEGIDLQKHVELKMKYNSQRERLHGKKF